MRNKHVLIAISAALLAFTSTATGAAPKLAPVTSDDLGASQEHAWSKGVPMAARLKARELFAKANDKFSDGLCAASVALHKEALTYWNHPKIHLKMAVALIHLDQLPEVREHLLKAVKYGPEPIGDFLYGQAKEYIIELETKQLARVTLECSDRCSKVFVDGREVLSAPGSKIEIYMNEGPHNIVAVNGPDYLPETINRVFVAGENTQFNLRPATAEEITGQVRRWPVWKPWALVAGGTALAIIGGGLHYAGAQKVHDLDANVQERSGNNSRGTSGQSLQRAAIGFYAVSGVAILTGTVWALMNQPKPFIKPQEQYIKFAPVVDGKTIGAMASIAF